jgi:hypothetical protein
MVAFILVIAVLFPGLFALECWLDRRNARLRDPRMWPRAAPPRRRAPDWKIASLRVIVHKRGSSVRDGSGR